LHAVVYCYSPCSPFWRRTFQGPNLLIYCFPLLYFDTIRNRCLYWSIRHLHRSSFLAPNLILHSTRNSETANVTSYETSLLHESSRFQFSAGISVICLLFCPLQPVDYWILIKETASDFFHCVSTSSQPLQALKKCSRITEKSVRSLGLWPWYINVANTILEIIHRTVFYLKTGLFGDWILSPSSDGTYSDGPNRKS
jgi:hypothetical protein